MAEINEIVSKQAIDGLVLTDKGVTKLDESTKSFISTVEKLSAELKKGNISFKEVQTAQKKVAKNAKELTQLEKDQAAASKALESQRLAGVKAMAKHTEALKKEVKSEDDLIKRTNALVAVRRKLDVSTDKGKAKHAQLTAEIKKNTVALKQQDKAISRSQRNVGNYGSALKGVGMQLAGALGLTSGIYLAIGALKKMFGTLAAFGQANATLAATLGKTREEIEDLTESAIAFGKSTKFTATEVSGLQNELAKLGFTTAEIKLQTNAVLQLAEATGADLAAAAKVTGVAIKAYGLSAADANDIVGTLAIATTKTALSFADYETALSTVGPVASAFGFTIEDTVALMGKLKDAGFDSSKASTALRNILLSLADANGDLAKKLGGNVTSLEDLIPALIKLDESGVSLNETLQLTDKRSVAAFNTLLSGADSVLELRDAITDASEALEEMVTVKTDNTIDAMARLGSAWDGVVLTFRNSEGFFVGFFDGLSGLLNSFTDQYVSGFSKYLTALTAGLIQIDKFEIAARAETLKELNKMNAQELSQFMALNWAKAQAGDEFLQDAIKLAQERKDAIVEAEKLAEERRLKIIKDANAQKLIEAKEYAAELAAILSRGIDIEEKRWLKLLAKIRKEKIDVEVDEDVFFPDIPSDRAPDDYIPGEDTSLTPEDKIQIAQDTFLALDAISDAFYSNEMARISALEAAIAKEKAYELKLAGDNQEEINKINKKYAKKEAALKTERAKKEKEAAIFSAIINIAQGITKTIAQGGVAGIILGAVVAALGAIQLANIATTPIPKFFKGTESAPDGIISVGEKGRELIQTRSGKMLMASQPTITSGLKGAKIFTNQETEKLLSGNTGYDSIDLREVVESNNRIEKAIRNQPHLQIDRANRTITERRGNYAKKYMNAKLTGI